MKSKVWLLIFFISFHLSLGKKFTRCEFVRKLYGHGLTHNELAKWTCIAEHMTDFNTSAIRGPFEDGTSTHGPFLISDRWWCVEGSKPSENYCRITCEELRSDSLSSSLNCARKIYYLQGYEAWPVWSVSCKNQLQEYKDCFPSIRGRRTI